MDLFQLWATKNALSITVHFLYQHNVAFESLKNEVFVYLCYIILPHRQIKYPVDFDDELKTRKRQIR